MHTVLVTASLGSVLGVGVVLVDGKGSPGSALLGVLPVAGSWTVVHTLYMLRYAHLYDDDAAH